MKIGLFTILSLVISLVCFSQETTYKNYKQALATVISSNDINVNSLSIHIYKSDYKLSVMSDTLILKEYPVVFGGNPTDDKLQEGDGCTPEGTFKIISKYPHRSWSKFIWIDYPNDQSWQKHNHAKRERLIPETASIGGEIGIHGVPEGSNHLIDDRTNWTLGCISLKNRDVNEIYSYISEKTIIEIE